MCLKNQYNIQKTHIKFYNILKDLNKFSKQNILFEIHKICHYKKKLISVKNLIYSTNLQSNCAKFKK